MPRLLAVDDESPVRGFLCEFLSARGYQVIEAATGEEGLRLLRELRPHLMLLDIMLPDMSGLAVLREAKSADPAVGVIMLTGVLDEAVGQQALQAGAFDFVTKPMDLKHLDRILWYKLTTMTLA